MRTGVAALMVMLAGCQAGAPPQTSAARSAGTVLSLTTDKNSYTIGETVLVTFDGFPGNPLDWISLAVDQSPPGAFISYSYTGGAVSGTYNFVATQPGTLVARGYFNDESVVQIESAPFEVVQGPAATITTTKAAYSPSENVVVNYDGLNGSQYDWIAIAPAGSPLGTFVGYEYKGTGGASGSKTFMPLPVGSYVARAFYSNSYILAGESATFTVAETSGVTTNLPSYTTGQPIVVSWTNLPGTPTDWIGIYQDGAPVGSFILWHYTDGNAAGQMTFPNTLQPGTYVARSFASDGFQVSAESLPFTVAASSASISTNLNSYVTGADIVVTFSGLPGGTTDWVAIVQDGSPNTSFIDWRYTGGGAGGQMIFPANYGDGTFRMRAFANNSFVVAAESAAFTVGGGATTTLTTDAPTYNSGDPVTVTFGGMAGSATDWIALAAPGSEDMQYVAYVYTGGGQSGQQVFSAVPAGTWVFRAYFSNGFVRRAESLPFTVNP
jgi:hypothetical protein